MKTEEDEAFDELAKRQGSWGGGFPAKRAMAADKLQEDLLNYGTAWSQDGKRIDPVSVYKEPAQEPAAMGDHQTLEALKYAASKGYGRIARENSAPFTIKEASAQPAQEQHWNEDEWRRNNWRCGHGWLRGEQCESCNAAQEPPSEWASIKAILDEYGLQAIDFVADFKAALAQPAQEPVECLDCGSNNVGLPATYDSLVDSVKAQPAQEQRPWVGLTPEDILALFDEHNLYGSKLVEFARAVETKIKEKNNG